MPQFNALYLLVPMFLAFFGYIVRIERTLMKISTELKALKEQVDKWQQ